MLLSFSNNVVYSVALLTALLFVDNADAQQDWSPPTFDPPARELVEEDAEYAVYFAAPARKGYMVVNDRGVERGPYDSHEQAHAAGMEQWWIVFEIEEIELPQTWYYWQTFDERYEANAECDWLEGIGFDSKITTIYKLSLKPGSTERADYRP